VQYHTSPGRGKSVTEQLGADKCSDDTDAPHTGNVADEGKHGFAHTLQHAFDDDGDAVEGLRDSNHAKYGSTKQNHFGILTEDVYHFRCKQEQQASGQNHEGDLDGKQELCGMAHALMVSGTECVAGHGSCGCLHPVAGDVERGFYRVCYCVCGGGDFAK